MRRLTALLPLLVAASMALLGVPRLAEQQIQGPEVEQFLKKARFVGQEPLGSGVTGSLKVTLQLDNHREFAVLKTIDQKRPGARPNARGEIEIDFQDSWKTEVAAYELDKLLGLGMVPATVQRTSPYDDKPGSLQLWVENAMPESKRREKAIIPPDADEWANQLSSMSIFDALIYNTDRHPDNLLITEDFRVRLIDHSRAFRPNAEIRNREDLLRFSRSLLSSIEGLTRSSADKSLGNYLTLSQIDGLMKRRQLILDLAKELARKQSEQAIFYP